MLKVYIINHAHQDYPTTFMYLLHVLVAGCNVGGYFCLPFQSVVDSSLFNAPSPHARLVDLGPWKDRRITTPDKDLKPWVPYVLLQSNHTISPGFESW